MHGFAITEDENDELPRNMYVSPLLPFRTLTHFKKNATET